MKTFLILLALGYASSEKLGLGYLPPPGSQYSGGRPEDIQVPLEFPKQTYSTTLRPQAGNNKLNPEDYRPTVGIDRIPGPQDISIDTPGSPLSQLQNTQRVPTTTVSYAFTQTTTHPPNEGFETTIGPQIAGGLPIDGFNNFPSQEPGLTYEENLNAQNRPSYQQNVNQFGQRPTSAPISGPAFGNLPSQEPGLAYEGNQNAQDRPINQFGQPTSSPTSGPLSQFTGSPIPSLTPAGQQFLGQNRPNQQQVLNQQSGYQQPITGNLPGASPTYFEQNQFRNQSLPGNRIIGARPGYVPSTVAPQGFSSTSPPEAGLPFITNAGNIPGSVTSGLQAQNYPGQEVQINGYQPGNNVQPSHSPIGQEQITGQRVNQKISGSRPNNQFGGVGNKQNVFQPSSTIAPGLVSQQFPGTSIAPGTEFSTQYPNQVNLPGSQNIGGLQRIPGDGQNVFQPSSTATPTFTPEVLSQDYPTGTSIIPGQRGQQYPTNAPGAYPTPANLGAQANAATYSKRPERPQADADRNAVVLNYENVITPEGYAYSYDTSNGIHADESGTTTDGTKAKGSYSYTGDDGKVYSVIYTADEDGFRPHGDHLPTPPPIPEAIQRVIEKAEKEKEAGISHDGFYDEDKYGYKKYQGARRPQMSNKMGSISGDVTEDDLPEMKLKQTRPHKVQGKPLKSGKYDEVNPETEIPDNEDIGHNDEQRQPGQFSTQRPQVTAFNGEGDKGGDLEEVIDGIKSSNQRPTNRPYVEVSSKRPINKSNRIQNNKINVPGSEDSGFRTGDQRHPIGRIPSTPTTKLDNDSDEYIDIEEPTYVAGDNKNRFTNKGAFRRPVDKEDEDQYENDYTTATGGYEGETSSKRPSQYRRPIIKENDKAIGQQTFDKYGRPIARIPSRRPVSSEDRFENLPSGNKNYDQQRFGSKRPSNKPSTYSPEQSQTVTDDYSLEEDYVTNSPSTLRPGSVKTKFDSRNQNVPIGIRRRPGSASSKAPFMPESEKNEPENNEEYIESYVDDYIGSQDKRRPTSPAGVPSNILGAGYDDIDQDTEDFDAPTQGGNRLIRPNVSSSAKYGRTRGKPQISDQSQEFETKRLNHLRPGTKYGLNTVRPGFNQETGSIQNEDYDTRPFNSTGYQYIPPRRKFEQDEVNRFPNRPTGTTRRPFTGRLSSSTTYYHDRSRPTKPFMTPNVSLNDNGEQEGYDQGFAPEQQENQFDGENFTPEDGTTPDQIYGDEIISSTRPPSKFTSSTYRPNHQQSTGKPQYIPGYVKDQTQKGRPSQGNNNRYYQGTKTPYGVISSTTPMPSSRPYESSSEPSTIGQENEGYSTSDGYHQTVPSQGFVSSTTPLPSQSPTIDGLYQQGTRPTAGYGDRISAQRRPTVGPTESVSIVPGVFKTQYQGNLPSTTYRPNYTITGQNLPSSTARSGVDMYGRPINKPGFGSSFQEQLPGSQPSPTVTPGVEIDAYGRPVKPGYGITSQEFIPGDQNVPSSTAAPGTVVDAFGRPVIRPDSGTATREYVPTNLNTFSSTTRPGVLVDRYGRPINTTEQINQQFIAGQKQPSSTARPGVSVDQFGQPISTPGSIPQGSQGYTSAPGDLNQGDGNLGQYQSSFGPSSENRFTEQQRYEGAPNGDQGTYQPGVTSSPSGQYRGNQKYQTGPTGYSRPSLGQDTVMSTFRPSTERIIGEDFSGPKQQQKFDSETGYYYK